MTWSRPHHLSNAEAQDWIRAEVSRLAEVGDIASASLARVTSTRDHARPCDWVCELQPRHGTPAAALLDDPVCAEWIRDLRLLGMKPTVAVLETTETVHPRVS
jgi:hypothetical protein